MSPMCQYGALLSVAGVRLWAGQVGRWLWELQDVAWPLPGLRWSCAGSQAFSSALRRGYCLFKLGYNSLCGRWIILMLPDFSCIYFV